jgi:4-hydroxyphenylacetate 3-monooxygenase
MDSLLPYTGKEFLESVNDGREVWIYGKRVNNIAEHPAFRNTARMIARLYDALHRDHAEKKNLLTCPTEWAGSPIGILSRRVLPRSWSPAATRLRPGRG